MKKLLVLLVIICLFAAGLTLFVWSGFYNIAANVPHWEITRWVIQEVKERSILAHSKGIMVPQLADQRLVNIGFQHYHDMCRVCHNAPGQTPTEISRGLYPPPPDFSTKQKNLLGDSTVFWIAKNGIKMTGMPAFGASHSEEEIRAIVHFVKRLPSLRAVEYDDMVKSVTADKARGHHH